MQTLINKKRNLLKLYITKSIMNQSPTKTEDMLKQLGNFVRTMSKPVNSHSSSSFIERAPTQLDIQKMLEESIRIISQKTNNSPKKLITKGKVQAASELLKQEKSILIKNYIKHKIQSEVFARPNNISQEENVVFQRQKQEMVQRRQKQIQEQKQKRRIMVKNVRQFDSNSRARIPVHQIDTILHKQDVGAQYLLKLTPTNSKTISSASNQVKTPNLYIDEIYSTQGYHKVSSNLKSNSPSRLRKDENQQEQYQQIMEETQNQEKFGQIYPNAQLANLAKIFKEKPHLPKIFYSFLEKQVKINSLAGAFNMLPNILKQQSEKKKKDEKQSKIHSWKNKPKKYSFKPEGKTFKKDDLSSIAQKYRLKGATLIQGTKITLEKPIVCQKRLNKMVGQSKKYHPKKTILTNNQLIYFDENQKEPDSKRIDLIIQKIQVDNNSKQEGSFFSKKEQNTSIVIVQGKVRLFKFQKSYLQGQQMYCELTKLMANKIYQLNSKLKGGSNLSLYNFINDEGSKQFNLSFEFLQPVQKYPDTQNRQLSLDVLYDLFAFRKDIQQISFCKSKLLPLQINEILTKCTTFSKLSKINFSHTRMTKANFHSLCQLVNSALSQSQFQIILQNCKLDDDILNSNVGLFTTFTSKVKYLDLTNNNFSGKSLLLLKNILQNITCAIKHLIINDCPFRDINRFSNMIGSVRKLEILEAKNCMLELDEKQLEQLDDFFSYFKRTQLKILNLKGNGYLSLDRLSILENNWGSQMLEKIFLDVKLKETGQNQGENVKNLSRLNLLLKL